MLPTRYYRLRQGSSCLALLAPGVTMPSLSPGPRWALTHKCLHFYRTHTVSPLPDPDAFAPGHRRFVFCCPVRHLSVPPASRAGCLIQSGLSSRVLAASGRPGSRDRLAFLQLRRDWDLNPGYLSVLPFSRRTPSAAQPSLPCVTAWSVGALPSFGGRTYGLFRGAPLIPACADWRALRLQPSNRGCEIRTHDLLLPKQAR
jgi:hypothetical protein